MSREIHEVLDNAINELSELTKNCNKNCMMCLYSWWHEDVDEATCIIDIMVDVRDESL